MDPASRAVHVYTGGMKHTLSFSSHCTTKIRTTTHGTNQHTNQSPYNDTVLSRAKQVVSRLYYNSSPEITPPHSTIQTIPHSSLTLSRSKCRLRCLSGYSNNGDGGWMIPRKKEWMKIKKRYRRIGLRNEYYLGLIRIMSIERMIHWMYTCTWY